MWHYVEGVENWDPVWPGHAIRILGGPSAMWFDALGRRLPAQNWLGYDTLGTLGHLRTTGHDHSWLVLNRAIAGREFTLSGSEQNLDLTDKSVRDVLRRPVLDMPASVQASLDRGADFVQAPTIADLVARMNALTPGAPSTRRHRGADSAAGRPGRQSVRQGRAARGDPHRTRLSWRSPHQAPSRSTRFSTRHTVPRRRPPPRSDAQDSRRIETDLDGRALTWSGDPFLACMPRARPPASAVAGCGYRALEGTFLGGCLFSGRAAGRAAAAEVA